MPTVRIAGVLAAGSIAVAGTLASVVLSNGVGSKLNELAIALAVTTYAVVGIVIMLARPGHLVGRLMLLGAATWGVGEGALALGVEGYVVRPGSIPAADWLAVLGTASRGFGWLVLVLALPLVFPDGHTPWRGRKAPTLTVLAIAAFTAATLLAPVPLEERLSTMDSPTGLPSSWVGPADALALSALGLSAVALGVAITGLVHRWRQGGDFLRQQLLWFCAAFAIPFLFIPFIATDLATQWMFALVTLPVPVAVGVALFQRRLYDVQLVVSRGLTYAALSVTVAGLYALTVGGVGALLQERGAEWLPWVAAGVVAVTFAPLRNTLQQGVNRLTYGQWSQPADVLAATGRRLADATDVPGLLHALTTELGTGLGLAYVEITDLHGRVLAAHGDRAETEELKLTAYGTPVGALRWSREKLRVVDRALLEDVAHQLGGVVHAAGLFDAIREAQERLVLAREEERRRLRRDLHDGLGPSLAGLTLQVDTLRNQLGRPGLDEDAELLKLRAGIQSTVVDVRRIVEGLRPPALDELGLHDALTQLAARVGDPHGDLTVTLDVPPLPPIPAAVEVATYRVAQEALTNVVRHARATRAHVRIALQDGDLALTISDNGTGDVHHRPGGVGLTSMRERAEEIGGTLIVQADQGGTTVHLRLPMVETSIQVDR
jgi:signal transduction histidine kinase